VNLFLTDVPIRDVFDLILRSNELAYDKQGNVFNIMTEAEYRGLYGKKFADLREVRSFRLQYAIPEQAFNMMDTLKSEIGRLLVDEDSGTVLILDTPDKLREMERALSVLESENSVRVFDLKYAKAKDIEDQLKDQLELKKLGFIKADARSNQVVVRTLPDRMDAVQTMIEALARKTREVLIASRIVKVTLNDSLDSGIDWNSVFSNLKFHGVDQPGGDFRRSTTGTAPSETAYVRRLRIPEFGLDTRSDTPGNADQSVKRSVKPGDLLFGTISRDGYELFRYLQTLGQTKLISNPRIMATEGQEARIHVGTREAYVTTTTTAGQTTTTTAEEIEFLDVGIQLVVTPTSINQDGFVTMKIKPEVSSVIRTLTTPSNNKIPIVDTSTAETNVMVKDGSTIIIGGLRKEQKKFTNDEVPMLGKMPLMGNLFKQRDTDDELAELVVFITPHIVQGDQLVTGDERKFGGGIKPFRGYEPVISTAPAPTGPTAPQTPAQRANLRFKDHLKIGKR
jgi:type II secretory pathway component GspD/PulD (secretin)